ncbi:S-adenosyl-L-methionine-dependent methyltransferase [Fusarium oxysporum]|nr:S-adenosyl-L-methionine-dependent methyltransferase [Fusarium oxysporum]
MSTPPAAATSPKSEKSPAKNTAKSPSKSPSNSPPQHAQVNVGDTGILEPTHWQQLAEEENVNQDDDAHSLSEESLASSTDSVTSILVRYSSMYSSCTEAHSNRAANDERQSELLDINHHCLTLGIGGKTHLAPLDTEKITKALDIGTGTGIWALDFADEYPNVEVIGTDVSPIQPSWVPPNLQFEIEDCTQEWTFAPNSADYIHIRWLIGSIPDWYKFFREAYKTCKPGGWVESFEPSGIITSDDDTVKESSALGQWGKLFIEGAKKLGVSFTVYEEELQRKAMEAAGFVDIQQFEYKVNKLYLQRWTMTDNIRLQTPIGGWPKDPELKELGQFGKLAFLADPEGFVLFVANTIGWTESEIHVFLAHARREIHSGKHHPYYKQRVVWGLFEAFSIHWNVSWIQNTSKTAIPENSKSIITITHVTTATAIVDIDGAKFITDPIFDEAPQSHERSHVAGLKPGEFFLTLQEGPAISIKQLPVIDCVLLSHEDHIDNLDETGR